METINGILRHFSQSQNKAYAIAGSMGGGLVSVHLLDIPVNPGLHDGLELVLKWVITILMACLTGLVTKMGADLWTIKIKPKLKIFEDEKSTDNQRRA